MVDVVTCANNESHVVNIWNSYLIVDDNKILIPAAGMVKTEENIKENPKVHITLGSDKVMGYQSMGTGFLLEGKAQFLRNGDNFNKMKEKAPFLTRTLEVTVNLCKQTL